MCTWVRVRYLCMHMVHGLASQLQTEQILCPDIKTRYVGQPCPYVCMRTIGVSVSVSVCVCVCELHVGKCKYMRICMYVF